MSRSIVPSLDSSVLTPARKLYLHQDRSIWCIVSAVDFAWIVKHRWNWGRSNGYYNKDQTKWYPRKSARYAKRNVGPERSTIWLHRAIMMLAEPHDDVWMAIRQVNHINGQSLDNRRCNLEWVTPSENMQRRIKKTDVPSVKWIWNNLCIDLSKDEYEEIPW